MSKNPEEALDFLGYVAEASKGWDETNLRGVERMRPQPNTRGGMYSLPEDFDMKAKLSTLARRLEELEMRNQHEVQAMTEILVPNKPCFIQCQVPTYAKFLKDLCTVKRGLNVDKKAFLTEKVSAIIQCKTLVKYKALGCPTISVNNGGTCVEKALLDLGAIVNLLPYSVDN